MTEREQDLIDAAREILSDFNTYGEVLQQGDNGEYGMESAIGRLNSAVVAYDKPEKKQYACECCSLVKTGVVWREQTEQFECPECYQLLLDVWPNG